MVIQLWIYYTQKLLGGPNSTKIVLKIRMSVGGRNLEHLNKPLDIFVNNLYPSRIYGVKIKKIEAISHLGTSHWTDILIRHERIFLHIGMFFMTILYLDLCLRGRGGICVHNCRGHICNSRIFHSFRHGLQLNKNNPF
jgi:hypothetical protein